LLHLLVGLPVGVVHSGNDQILQHLDIVLRDHFRIDLDSEKLLGAVERGGHHAAAGGCLHAERGHLLLQPLLHLLRLLHHLLNLLGIHISSPSRISAGKTSSRAWTPASASASSFNADFRSASLGRDSLPAGGASADISATTAIFRPASFVAAVSRTGRY